MSFTEHATEFGGRPVVEYDPQSGLDPTGNNAVRVYTDYDSEESIVELIARLLEDPHANTLRSLVIGAWQGEDSDASSEPIVEALVAARESLPNLTALFLGDIIGEENEVSWIQQSDVTALFDAYPRLEHFRVRGGMGLEVGKLQHPVLRSLVVESGGLDAEVVRGIAGSNLPRLEHLEIWTGTDNYGGTVGLDDLKPLLEVGRFPALKRLGICNSEIADAVAALVATSPILGAIEVLDLSSGNLTDEGAQALVSSPGITRLKKLDIHYHFLSEEMIGKLQALGIEVDASDPQTPYDWGNGELHRFIAVTE